MFGYESYVTLNDQVVLATSADLTSERSKIESSGLYGGSLNQGEGVTTIPLQQANYYDWSDYSGSVTAEVTPEILTLLQDLILGRANSFDFKLYSRIDGLKHMSKAWWNSIVLTAQEDSAVSVTIGFTGLEVESFLLGTFNNYFENENGLNNCEGLSNPLNPESGNFSPIPFWRTEVLGLENVKNWTFSITQDVVKFVGCMNSSTILEPYILGVGMVKADMKISSVLPDTDPADTFVMFDVYNGSDSVDNRKDLTLIIDGNDYMVLSGEINRIGDPLSGNSSLNNLDWDYTIYDFNFS